jgi:hypothetical protein
MDPITLIITALASGVAAAIQEASGDAIKNAYQGLKNLVRRRLTGNSAAEVALEKHAEKPEVWEAPLKDALSEAGADQDKEIVEAAQRLMALIDPEQAAAGRFNTKVSGNVQGWVQGNHARVDMRFGRTQED